MNGIKIAVSKQSCATIWEFANKIKNPSAKEEKMDSSAFLVIKEHAKQLLYNKIFIGNYKETRYVEALTGYRDVVLVNNSEKLLKQDLQVLREKIKAMPQLQCKWIGITEPETDGVPAMHCIWTDVGDIPFGRYWFQIKSLRMKPNEIFLKLHCLRPLDHESIPEKNKNDSKTSSPSESTPNKDIGIDDFKEKVIEIKNQVLRDVLFVLSYNNIKTALWFTSVFIFTFGAALLNSVQYIGDFSLKLVRELSALLRTLTPIIIALIDFFTKCVGGFYILLSMLWRGNANLPARQMFPQAPQRALPMPQGRYYAPRPGASEYWRGNPKSNTLYQQHSTTGFR